MAGKLELQPGEITEAEFQRMMNVTRFTTRNWRINGLPYRKVGKFIVYKESEIRPWIQAKLLTNIMRLNSEIILAFEENFREATALGESFTTQLQQKVGLFLSRDTSTSDEQKQDIREALDASCDESIAKMQAKAVYWLAKELQKATPRFLLAHENVNDIDYADIKVDEETLATVKLLLKQIERLSNEQADHLIAIMDSAYKESLSAEESVSDGNPDQMKFFDDLPKTNVARG